MSVMVMKTSRLSSSRVSTLVVASIVFIVIAMAACAAYAAAEKPAAASQKTKKPVAAKPVAVKPTAAAKSVAPLKPVVAKPVAVAPVTAKPIVVKQSVAAERKLVKVEVFPKTVQLTTSRDHQGIVVQATFANGVTSDVSGSAKYTLADGKLAKFHANALLPIADGETTLTVEFGGNKLTVPVTVKDAAKDRLVSFKNDVMPVFMRSGCNSGSCHGAARGKDGFMLSIFGYDPDGDLHRITRQQPERRINLAIPSESLLVKKSLGTVPHTGGESFKPDSLEHKTLLRWLEAGVPKDAADLAEPVKIDFLPKNGVLEGENATQRMVVVATYSDGTTRDVTNLALFQSNNSRSADISKDGVVTAGVRGEAYVFARFFTFTVGSQFVVIPKGLKYQWSNEKENNYIDKLVFAKHQKLRITPSQVCSDDVFFRRAYLDIVGKLPNREEFEKYAADKSPNKRENLVDVLLGRKEFVELWVMKFAELLQISSDNNRRMSYKATLLYYNWLSEKFSNNVPMDKIVQELLSASGGTFTNPATNYYQIEQDTLKVSENVAQVFMGMRIQCAQCHNHPFDRWTMDDYYSFAAFFSQVGRKRAEDPREQIIYNRFSGSVTHPVSKKVMEPKFLGGDVPVVKGKDRREIMAKWLASPQNPFFARNLANIVWAHFLGRGVIHPVDDVRVSNPPVNPELLEEMATRFTDYKYDFKKLVRDICTSRVYQLATKPNSSNELDTTNFSHAQIRRVRAEVLLDVISQVTETKNKFKGLPLGARAVQIADGRVSNYFLTTFGRATRETVCSCEVVMEPNLSQALHLLLGDTINNRVTQGGVVKNLLAAKQTPEHVIEELYVRCVSRKPTPIEMANLMKDVNASENKQQALEDVFWALMNAKEFIFNH
jgi:hypothetical protein